MSTSSPERVEVMDITVTQEQAIAWKHSPNQQDFCDEAFGLCRQDPNYWLKLDLIEDSFLDLIEVVELPFPSPAEL